MNDDFGKLSTTLTEELSHFTLSELFSILQMNIQETDSPTVNSIQNKVKELSLFSHYTFSETKYSINSTSFI